MLQLLVLEPDIQGADFTQRERGRGTVSQLPTWKSYMEGDP